MQLRETSAKNRTKNSGQSWEVRTVVITTQWEETASGWSHEASSHPAGQELKNQLFHGPQHCRTRGGLIQGTDSQGALKRLCSEEALCWVALNWWPGAAEGGGSEALGAVRVQEQPGHRKPPVQPLPVLSLLLLRGVHKLICGQLQDKWLFDCKLEDLEEKSNRTCHFFSWGVR